MVLHPSLRATGCVSSTSATPAGHRPPPPASTGRPRARVRILPLVRLHTRRATRRRPAALRHWAGYPVSERIRFEVQVNYRACRAEFEGWSIGGAAARIRRARDPGTHGDPRILRARGERRRKEQRTDAETDRREGLHRPDGDGSRGGKRARRAGAPGGAGDRRSGGRGVPAPRPPGCRPGTRASTGCCAPASWWLRPAPATRRCPAAPTSTPRSSSEACPCSERGPVPTCNATNSSPTRYADSERLILSLTS